MKVPLYKTDYVYICHKVLMENAIFHISKLNIIIFIIWLITLKFTTQFFLVHE